MAYLHKNYLWLANETVLGQSSPNRGVKYAKTCKTYSINHILWKEYLNALYKV